MIGNADSPQELYYAVGAEQVGRPDINESNRIAWIAIDDALKMIERGEIVGAATGSESYLLALGSMTIPDPARIT